MDLCVCLNIAIMSTRVADDIEILIQTQTNCCLSISMW